MLQRTPGQYSYDPFFTLQAKINRLAVLGPLPSMQTKLLQLARSTPLLLSAVVGHKTKHHVEDNLKLVSVRPLSNEAFLRAVKSLEE